MATLFDAYFGFLTFFVWVAYKERTILALLLITGGLMAIEQPRYKEKALRAAITKAKRTAIGPPGWARYNAPFWPWFMRQNEILVEVRP